MLLKTLLSSIVRRGTLHVRIGEKRPFEVGNGKPPEVSILISDEKTARRIALRPTLAVGEAYMDGSFRIENGSIRDFLELVSENLGRTLPKAPFPFNLPRALHRLRAMLWRRNSLSRAKRNVAHHYDLSYDLYRLFLDQDMNYSCAYFKSPGDSLETAQEQKLAHIAAKLCLKPDMHVLDIGCGWGAMALHLARNFNVRVTGITLSNAQAEIARQRVRKAGLQDRVHIDLIDYRKVTGTFDRVVSIGMFEHVGMQQYRDFFAAVKERLGADGIALIHHIARADGPGMTNPWIDKYIFPGGYCPALSEVMPKIEQAGFYLTDLEILRLHYAYTLQAWQDRFQQSRDQIKALYDERFCRMWEFYLAGSEMSFRHSGHVVAQWQIAVNQTAVPLTRGYIDKNKVPYAVSAKTG